MPLTDLACRSVQPTEKPQKLSDEKGLYLLVNRVGKYWRWDFRFGGKRKTMALGVYPEVSLSDARSKRDSNRRKLNDGGDPMADRKIDKLLRATASSNSFKAVALAWHENKSKKWAEITAAKTLKHLEHDMFPALGSLPVHSITAPMLLATLRKVSDRGAGYTAIRLREISGQIFRFARATGFETSNPTTDLKGALSTPQVNHRPAITDPRKLSKFLQTLKTYGRADPLTLSATKIAILTFVRSQELRLAEWDEINFEACEWP